MLKAFNVLTKNSKGKALKQIRDVTEIEITERHGHHIGKKQHSKNKYK